MSSFDIFQQLELAIEDGYVVEKLDGEALVDLSGADETHPDVVMYKRIVACVNACKGIPTEVLEVGVLSDLINAVVAYVGATLRRRTTDDQFTLLHEAVRKIAFHRLREWEAGEA